MPITTKHFKERSRQRFGIKLNQKQAKSLINALKAGEGRLIKKARNGKTAQFTIKRDNTVIKVVVDLVTDTLITILYPSKSEKAKQLGNKRRRGKAVRREKASGYLLRKRAKSGC